MKFTRRIVIFEFIFDYVQFSVTYDDKYSFSKNTLIHVHMNKLTNDAIRINFMEISD